MEAYACFEKGLIAVFARISRLWLLVMLFRHRRCREREIHKARNHPEPLPQIAA